MALDEVSGQAWTRKHDDPRVALFPSVARTAYPKSLEELIDICKKRQAGERIRAAGSHWALSEAAVADQTFVECHDPADGHQAMGKTLYEVVPPCLNPDFIAELARRQVQPYDTATVSVNEGLYPIHIETGKRVYQLYAELDNGDTDRASLANLLADKHSNPTYLGPWAFRTLGGAGGQTVFGALTTGTHGGDFLATPDLLFRGTPRMPPIANSVMAMHLVADGGKHFWIEPESLTQLGVPLTDRDRLDAHYGDQKFGGPDNFLVIRDDNLFNSVLISVGRFGIVYSIVIAAVRQYTLHQERRLSTWQSIKSQLGNPATPSSPLFTTTEQAGQAPRFLQIGVCLTPHLGFERNLVGITKRWNVPLAPNPSTQAPAGRQERRGTAGPFNQQIQAPLFEFAGNSAGYVPDKNNPGLADESGFLAQACSNGNFMLGVLETVLKEVKEFVESNGAVVGGTIAAVTAIGGPGALALLASLAILLAVLVALIALVAALTNPRFGEVMDEVREQLLDRPDPAERAAGIFIWQMIVFLAFKAEQSEGDYEAISYVVMDGHDYLDKSCNINVDFVEVFFDATDRMLIAYVDSLINFEIGQEVLAGKAAVGYASLRFTGQTRALIGPERFPLTCAVEVAALVDVKGSQELVDFATMLALDGNFNAILHWGQRNDSKRRHIQERFGDTFNDQSGGLRRWRAALSRITENGRLEGFSSRFTRETGLEIVNPVVGTMTAQGAGLNQPISITWDCVRNPPNSVLRIEVQSPVGVLSSFNAQPLAGQLQVNAVEIGTYMITLTISINLGGETREDSTQAFVPIAA